MQLHLGNLSLSLSAAMFEGRLILLRLTKIEGSSYFALHFYTLYSRCQEMKHFGSDLPGEAVRRFLGPRVS